MNRFDREHIDGVGDGLSIAYGILEKARSTQEALDSVRAALLLAREAKDRHNLAELKELASWRVPARPS